MSKNKRLLPCPFCGGEVSAALGGDNADVYYFVTRGNGKNACKCRVFMEGEKFDKGSRPGEYEINKAKLIRQWNKRSKKKYCYTGKHYDVFEGVCCNGNSDHRADFRCLDDTCEEWEGIKDETRRSN